jgi:hypothetical protein
VPGDATSGQWSGRITYARRVGYAMPERTTKRAAQRPRTANGRASPSAAGGKESRAPRVSRSRTPISQSGVSMTDQLADELAEDAAEGHDPVPRPTGRPRVAHGCRR